MSLWQLHKPSGLKTPYQVRKIESLTKILYELFLYLDEFMKEDTTGLQIDSRIREFALRRGIDLPLLTYNSFNFSACINRNETIVHGKPDAQSFSDGDVVIVDTVLGQGGWCADASWTWQIGRHDSNVQSFLRTALGASIAAARTSARGIGAMAHAVKELIHKQYFMLPNFAGHGIGRNIHEHPRINLYPSGSEKQEDILLVPGTVFTVEPVISLQQGMRAEQQLDGSWTLPMGGRAAQFELMVSMEVAGPRILGLDLLGELLRKTGLLNY
jgi:methionyl aminopeptidase